MLECPLTAAADLCKLSPSLVAALSGHPLAHLISSFAYLAPVAICLGLEQA